MKSTTTKSVISSLHQRVVPIIRSNQLLVQYKSNLSNPRGVGQNIELDLQIVVPHHLSDQDAVPQLQYTYTVPQPPSSSSLLDNDERGGRCDSFFSTIEALMTRTAIRNWCKVPDKYSVHRCYYLPILLEILSYSGEVAVSQCNMVNEYIFCVSEL